MNISLIQMLFSCPSHPKILLIKFRNKTIFIVHGGIVNSLADGESGQTMTKGIQTLASRVESEKVKSNTGVCNVHLPRIIRN